MLYGINKAIEEIERKKKVKELTEKWLKEGSPLELPTSSGVIRDRE